MDDLDRALDRLRAAVSAKFGGTPERPAPAIPTPNAFRKGEGLKPAPPTAPSFGAGGDQGEAVLDKSAIAPTTGTESDGPPALEKPEPKKPWYKAIPWLETLFRLGPRS